MEDRKNNLPGFTVPGIFRFILLFFHLYLVLAKHDQHTCNFSA